MFLNGKFSRFFVRGIFWKKENYAFKLYSLFRAGMSNSNPCVGRIMTGELSADRSLEIFSCLFCSCAISYQNMSMNLFI